MRTRLPFVRLGALCLALVAPAPLVAQSGAPGPGASAVPAAARADTARPTKWDVSVAHGPAKTLEFSTDEGTWLSLDVSPDGQQIAFDLLGDVYLLPIAGGEARLLLGGGAYETQPRFSPDGKRLAFTSDRDGTDNLWVVNLDGTGLKQVTKEKERQVNSAAWAPDGQALVGRKHYRNTRSLGAGEQWLFHLGGGEGLQLTARRNWEQNAGEPVLSPDGRYLYYSEDVSPGGGFQYNRDPHGSVYVIQRLDRQTGEKETFLRGAGGAVRPTPSPDGKTLAFVRRVGLKTTLFTHDLASGREKLLWDGLSHDQQEAWAIFGTYPTMAWTPDGRSLVLWAQGKLWRVDAASGAPTPIPFRAQVKQTITEALRFPQAVAPDSFDVKMLRSVSVAPDGRSVVFQALGKLWLRELPDGRPRRLTRDESHFEFFPAWSADGRRLVYTTWHDRELGSIRVVNRDGSGARTLTRQPGHYVEPQFSQDGQKIVFRRVGTDGLRSELFTREPGVYWLPASGGEAQKITTSGTQPRFNRKGDRVYLVTAEPSRAPGEPGRVGLASVNLSGGDRILHLVSDNAGQIVLSPDERFVAWTERFQAYVAPFALTGQTVTLAPKSSAYPVQQVTRDAGVNLHWSPDGRRLYWSLGPELFQRELGRTFAWAAEGAAADTTPVRPDSTGVFIGFRLPGDRPAGTVALVGGTVISMKGEEVIPDATVLVQGNRITAVGPAASVAVPVGATRVDVAGKFLMPGLVDVHAHTPVGGHGLTPQANWSYLANLAFGVTTMHDPSNNTEMVFAGSELLKAGRTLGPRLYSTGTILYGAEGGARAQVNNLDDALGHLRRLKAVGAFSVKSYNQPRRDARQQIVEAARRLGMMVVPEGGSTYHWNMTHVLDGHTGMEHNIPVAPLYNDALSLIAASQTGYTPTLIVNYGGLSGEYYWYQESNVWENDRLLRFTPRDVVEPRSRRRAMAATDDYYYVEVSKAAKTLLDHGGKVQLGAHGQLQGLGAHWELWMLGQGGMTPHQALRAATLHGAQYLGLDGDLGSIEPGKLADLLVLDRNPLENLRHSESVRQVMLNGRLYDAWTLAQQGAHPAPAPHPFWRDIETSQAQTMTEGALHGH